MQRWAEFGGIAPHLDGIPDVHVYCLFSLTVRVFVKVMGWSGNALDSVFCLRASLFVAIIIS